MEKMSHLLETYVRSDTRYDKQQMLRSTNLGGSSFDFIIGELIYNQIVRYAQFTIKNFKCF